MKVLYVTSKSPDHLSVCLWDGLQEVLGEANVVDAVGATFLHASSAERACMEASIGERRLDSQLLLRSIGGYREGRTLQDGEKDFDALVLHACFNREHDWAWAKQWLFILKPNAPVAYVEGWDAAWQVNWPPFDMRVNAGFRKEIDNRCIYPHVPYHLTFAAPARWFDETGPEEDSRRAYDVVWIGNPETGHPGNLSLRWDMLRAVFSTRHRHKCVIATRGLSYYTYLKLLRDSKLALCPAAADGADSTRTYEAAAAGAIPVFVGYPDHRRDPWFPPETCFSCTPKTLAEHIDEALAHDQTEKRRALVKHAREHHTTAARARKVLQVLGF